VNAGSPSGARTAKLLVSVTPRVRKYGRTLSAAASESSLPDRSKPVCQEAMRVERLPCAEVPLGHERARVACCD